MPNATTPNGVTVVLGSSSRGADETSPGARLYLRTPGAARAPHAEDEAAPCVGCRTPARSCLTRCGRYAAGHPTFAESLTSRSRAVTCQCVA